MIRKATVLKEKKFSNIYNEQFDTIVYCILDTVYAVLAGINFVISEAACYLKIDPSRMMEKFLNLKVKSCMMEKFFKVLMIFLQGCCQPRNK